MRPSHEDSDHGFASGQMCHGPGPAAENWMRLNSGAMELPFRMLTRLSLQFSENETREKRNARRCWNLEVYLEVYLEDFGGLKSEQPVSKPIWALSVTNYTSSWHTGKQEYQERVRVSWPSSEFTTALVRIAGSQETWYFRGVIKSGEIEAAQ